MKRAARAGCGLRAALLLALALGTAPAAASDEAAARQAFERGRALYLAGRYADARAPLLEAYHRSGQRPSTIRALALVERALGHADAAIRLWREYLATGPGEEERRSALQALSELEAARAPPPPEQSEPDFLWDSRSREVPPPAPEVSAPPPPPPEEAGVALYVLVPVVALAVGALVVGLVAVSGRSDPYGGSLGVVLAPPGQER